MSVLYDAKSKTYYSQFYFLDSNTRKRIYKKKRGFKRKKDAIEWEHINRNKSESISMQFNKIAKLYIESLDSNKTTKQKKYALLNHHVDFANKNISKISKLDLVNWENKLKDSSLSTRSINSIISLVKSIYSFSSLVYGTADNSIVLKKKKMNPFEMNEMETWTIEEFETFLFYVKHPVYHAFFRTLFWTGLRRGEAIALLKDDLLEDSGEIQITKSMKHFKNGFTPPKTPNAVRKVSLDVITLSELKSLKSRTTGAFLFGDEEPLSISGIQRVFTQCIKESGVKKIRLHDLRHSHATILINSGVNIVAVSKRLGHSDISITLKTYTHLLEKTNKELTNKLNELAKSSK